MASNIATPTIITIPPLTINAARVLTDEVKADASALWAKLLQLYEGQAHTALGYGSWGEYYAEEIGESKSRGYQILKAARVDRMLGRSTIVDRPANEAVARELVPVLRENPEQVPEVWGEVVDLHGPSPTAAQVREVVREPIAAPSRPGPEYVACPTCGHRVRADKPLNPRRGTR